MRATRGQGRSMEGRVVWTSSFQGRWSLEVPCDPWWSLGSLVVPRGPWSSITTSPVHLLLLPHLQIWKGIGGHTSAVSGMRLLNLVLVLDCAKTFTAVFTSGWSIVLSLLSTDSPSQVRAAPSSCEALSLCPVLSCDALLLACTMHYAGAQLVWGVMIWYVGTVC